MTTCEHIYDNGHDGGPNGHSWGPRCVNCGEFKPAGTFVNPCEGGFWEAPHTPGCWGRPILARCSICKQPASVHNHIYPEGR